MTIMVIPDSRLGKYNSEKLKEKKAVFLDYLEQ